MPDSFSGVPSFFRGCCHTASQGGNLGFDHPGYELMRHVRRLIPHELDYQDWSQVCDRLDCALADGDKQAVEAWFVTYYPRCMALVPTRRRAAFLKGVFQRAADLDITQHDAEECSAFGGGPCETITLGENSHLDTAALQEEVDMLGANALSECDVRKLEQRLRGIARRQGLCVQKSRRRNPQAADYHRYRVLRVQTNSIVSGNYGWNLYSLDLDGLRRFLNKPENGAKSK
jgi:hypothetical protein